MSTRRGSGPGSGPGDRDRRGARSGRSVPPNRAVPPGRRPASSSRPAASRRSASGSGPGPAVKRTRAPQPRRFTGRAAVLGMVLLGLLLAYAYPVRVYLAQQAEIAGLEEQQQEQRQRIAALTETRQKWDDDEYVKTRARNDLHYVLPGENAYIPLPDPGQPAGQPDPDASKRAVDDPWYRKLWSSVGAADRPADRPAKR